MSRIPAISRAMARACANSSAVIRSATSSPHLRSRRPPGIRISAASSIERLLTEIPRRGLKVSSPSLANSRIASRTGVMLTPSKDEMCAWVSLCPGRKQPENIASRSHDATWSGSVPFPSSAKCGNFGELIFLVGPADLAIGFEQCIGPTGGAPPWALGQLWATWSPRDRAELRRRNASPRSCFVSRSDFHDDIFSARLCPEDQRER